MARSKFSAILLFLLPLGQIAGQSEQPLFSGQVPQARTQKEFDAWIEIISARTPPSIIRSVQHFLKSYPNSDFQASAYHCEMKAWQELGRAPETIIAAEQVLRIQPDNIEASIALALELPGVATDSDDPRLDSAKRSAEDATGKLANQRLPRSLTPDRWDQVRKRIEGEIHLARARIAEKEGKAQEAIDELGLVIKSGFPDLQRDARRQLERTHKEAK